MRTAAKNVGKRPWPCVDGPWKGHTLYLVDNITSWFVLGGVVGRYAYGKYQVQP